MIKAFVGNSTATLSPEDIALDNIWLLFSATMIFFMQAGFTMLEAGSVSSENTVNVLFKNISDTCVSSLAFWLVGYGFAYGRTFYGVIGTTEFGSVFDNGSKDATSYALYFLKWAFAATTATIVSGSLAERCKLDAYFLYTFFITAFIYPVIACWCWGGGWLSPFPEDNSNFLFFGEESNNYIDFAGSGVVHMVGGIGGFVGAVLCGPRKDRFHPNGTVSDLPKHSLVILTLGVFLLWIGWYGFNMGSTECASQNCTIVASKVAVVTTISAGAGGVTAIFGQRLFGLKKDVVTVCNGIIAGLVSITAGCAIVEPWAAVIIGILGFCVYSLSSLALLKFQIDDPLDGSALHGACGFWGVLVPGIFGTDSNAGFVGYRGSAAGFTPIGSGEQFGIQMVGAMAITVWTLCTSYILFSCIKATIGLRINDDEIELGLDETTHGQRAYNMEIHTFSSKRKRTNQEEKNHAYHPVGLYVDVQKFDRTMIDGIDEEESIDVEIPVTEPININGRCEDVD